MDTDDLTEIQFERNGSLITQTQRRLISGLQAWTRQLAHTYHRLIRLIQDLTASGR
jgi:hypothetical protein